jgi:hypothetical protein
MAKHLKLQHSESVVLTAASQIYAAYITSGKVSDGDEDKMMAKSIREAIKLAVATDEAIISDAELS